MGQALAVVFAPIGFNWQISIALVPGMAAREVVVSSLATVYALSSSGVDAADALVPLISSGWSLATALSLLAWFVRSGPIPLNSFPRFISGFSTLLKPPLMRAAGF
jgi:ferrous iron transport protein B